MKNMQMGLFGECKHAEDEAVLVEKKTNYQEGRLYFAQTVDIADSCLLSRSQNLDDDFDPFIESLRVNGILQPIVCTIDDNGKLMLAAGVRRLRAAKIIGLPKIPMLVIKGDPAEISLIENVMREGLSVVEESEALSAIKARKSYRLEDLATLRGKAVSTISEILAVALLPAEIRDDCRSNKDVPRDILVNISRLSTDGEKIAFYQDYKAGLRTRKEIISAKRRPMSNNKRPYAFISRFSKQICKIDLDKMVPNEYTSYRSELKKLYEEIGKILDITNS
jgi:ParB/RepB/Spo0J family partition protein